MVTPVTLAAPYVGTLYLLHLQRPLRGARNQFGPAKVGHYLGWTQARSVARRVALHASGQSGSKYMRQAFVEGCAFDLVRVWRNADRLEERRLKNGKKLARLCPACKCGA
jgi:hypothetical protein